MGLHRDVIQAMRCCRGLDRLLYVSCNPNSLADNLYGLCMPSKKSRRGPCFVPREVIGADFFPGTRHVETICLLERSTLFEDYFWLNKMRVFLLIITLLLRSYCCQEISNRLIRVLLRDDSSAQYFPSSSSASCSLLSNSVYLCKP